MTLLKRRVAREQTDSAADEQRERAAAVSSCEYVEVEDTALVRVTGTWNAKGGRAADMALVVSRGGRTEQTLEAMSDGSTAAGADGERATWQVSFGVPIRFVESASSQFALRIDADEIDLPRPRRHDPESTEEPEQSFGGEEEFDPEARVRQAEAAITWTQRQLARERDARRRAEQEVAAATPEIEARQRELEHIAALERQVGHLAEERQRRADLETRVSELSTQVTELSREHDFYEELKERVSELAIDRDRLLSLEPRVAELTAEATSLMAERDQLRAERELLGARVSELSEQLERTASDRDRLAPFEGRVEELEARMAELDADRDRLGTLEAEAAELVNERARRLELQEQMGEVVAERDRLRALEEEVALLRTRRDALESQARRVTELEGELEDLRAASVRAGELEDKLAAVTAERDRLQSVEVDAAAAAQEHERRRALEKRISSQAVEHQRVEALEHWVADLRRALTEARDELLASEKARSELRAEMSRIRGESAELEAQLGTLERGPGKPVGPDVQTDEPAGEEDGGGDDADDTRVLDLEADEEEPAAGSEGDSLVVESDREVVGEPVSCTACDALGSCRRCGGRGRRFGRRCVECNGSGTCSICGGPGYLWVGPSVGQSQ